MNFVGGIVWLEIFHYLGIAFWLGSVAMLDFRLMGFSPKVPVRAFHLSAASYIGFALTAVTGILMYLPTADAYNTNSVFLLKMALLILAILFAFFVQSKHVRESVGWPEGRPPSSVRIAGAFSLLLWFGILAAGRMITYYGFTQG